MKLLTLSLIILAIFIGLWLPYQKKIEHEHMLITKLPALSLQILEYTREHGRATVSELVTLTGVSRNTIRKYLYNLVASNYLELVGRGRGSWYKIK